MGNCTIYVTGDDGEDLFTRSDVGSRAIHHSSTYTAADRAHDFWVPRGASFISSVLDLLLKPQKIEPPNKKLETGQNLPMYLRRAKPMNTRSN